MVPGGAPGKERGWGCVSHVVRRGLPKECGAPLFPMPSSGDVATTREKRGPVDAVFICNSALHVLTGRVV